MSKIKSIYLRLLNEENNILTEKQILDIIKEYNYKVGKVSVKNTLWYLSRHNYIKRIFFNYYYINSIKEREMDSCDYSSKELLFIVLNKEKIKWYLGLNTSIYEQGKILQTPVKLNIVNNRLSGDKSILGLNARFFKIKDELIFGFKGKKTENGVRYFYSDSAKTYIDMVYFRMTKKLIRLKNTKKYLELFPKWVGKR